MKILRNLPVVLALVILFSCGGAKEPVVTIKTKFGDMKVVLHDATPIHKANFLKLAREGAYDSTIWHRVIKEFMVQGGDIYARDGKQAPRTELLTGEFVDSLYHRKGALAAARMGDNMNPERKSSDCQFYIVHGKKFSGEELDQLSQSSTFNKQQQKIGELLRMPQYSEHMTQLQEMKRNNDMAGIQDKLNSLMPIVEKEFGAVPQLIFTDAQKEVYSTQGGSPHLDGDYTVFGQVIDGLDVIDALAQVKTQMGDKPLEDIYITMTVEEMKQKDIVKLYGYNFLPQPDKK